MKPGDVMVATHHVSYGWKTIASAWVPVNIAPGDLVLVVGVALIRHVAAKRGQWLLVLHGSGCCWKQAEFFDVPPG